MSKAPSMPVFVDALVGDTLDLSPEEFGAYCLILFTTWRHSGSPLPDDDHRMARICRVTKKRWRERIRPALVRYFDLSGGTWRQHRLEKEWDYVAKQVEQKRCAGIASHKAKALKSQDTDSTAVAEPLQRQCQQPSPSPNPNPKDLESAQPAESRPPAHAREAATPAGLAGCPKILEEWIDEAASERSRRGLCEVDLRWEAEKAEEHWRDNPPLNPRAAWIGWGCRARPEQRRAPVGGYKPDVPDEPAPPIQWPDKPIDQWPAYLREAFLSIQAASLMPAQGIAA
jgi:uncharacterized protein YdaU (DUF1376 family)